MGYPLTESAWKRGWNDTKTIWTNWQFFVLDAVVAVVIGGVFRWYWGLAAVLFGMFCVWIGSTASAPVRQRNEARNMMLRTRFYLKFESIEWKLISRPTGPFKGSISFQLTISNQENVPRSASRFMLEIESENGDKKELPVMNLDGETEADITLYLHPHESKVVRLNFVYEVKPMQGSERLYVFDDLGAWCCVPINVDTMVTMAKKSTARSGNYRPI